MLKPALVALSLLASSAAVAEPVLWIGDEDGTLGTFDPGTGEVRVVGQMRVVMTDIAFDATGQLWGISFTHLYRIDARDASIEAVTPRGKGFRQTNSLVFAENGTLYAANDALNTLDTRTGALRRIGTRQRYASSGDLAFVGGRLLLTTAGGAGGDDLVELNLQTGKATPVGNTGIGEMYGLVSPDGSALYGVSYNRVYTIDPQTGAAEHVATYDHPQLGTAWGAAFDRSGQTQVGVARNSGPTANQ